MNFYGFISIDIRNDFDGERNFDATQLKLYLKPYKNYFSSFSDYFSKNQHSF